jgi:hypothetical protein
MIAEPGFKLEPKDVAVQRVVFVQPSWEDEVGCSCLVIVSLARFNNGIRGLESTPSVLPVLHNKALSKSTLVYKMPLFKFQCNSGSLGLAPFGIRHKQLLYKQIYLKWFSLPKEMTRELRCLEIKANSFSCQTKIKLALFKLFNDCYLIMKVLSFFPLFALFSQQ